MLDEWTYWETENTHNMYILNLIFRKDKISKRPDSYYFASEGT